MRRISLLTLLILLAFAIEGMASEKKEWQTVRAGKVGNIEVQLKCLPKACLSDESWISLHFVNSGKKSVRVTNASYRIERVTHTLDRKSPISSGGLASGNTYDLFHEAWETTPVSGILISPGVHNVVEHPSRYSSTLLGLPPKEGWFVKARLHLSLQMEDHEDLETPEEGVPFEFEWRYPNDKGFERMQARLMELLRNPQEKSHHCHAYILGTLLEIPEISDSISLKTLQSALNKRSGGFDGRREVAKRILRKGCDREELVRFYRSRLQGMDYRVCDDLRVNSIGFWDTSFIEPLVVMHEKNRKSPPFVSLRVLFQHSDDWKDDEEVTRRLSAVLLRRFGTILKRTPEDLKKKSAGEYWAMYVPDLAMTRDKDVLPLLTPFLDHKTQVRDPSLARSGWPGEIPRSHRACDVALDAILTILDGNVERAYKEMGIPPASDDKPNTLLRKITVEEATAWRDKMIVMVKKRLAAMDKKRK